MEAMVEPETNQVRGQIENKQDSNNVKLSIRFLQTSQHDVMSWTKRCQADLWPFCGTSKCLGWIALMSISCRFVSVPTLRTGRMKGVDVIGQSGMWRNTKRAHFIPSVPLISLPPAEVLWPVSVFVPRKWPLAEHLETTWGRSSLVPFVWTSTRTPSYSSAATISAAFASACTGTKMAMTTDISVLNAER